MFFHSLFFLLFLEIAFSGNGDYKDSHELSFYETRIDCVDRENELKTLNTWDGDPQETPGDQYCLKGSYWMVYEDDRDDDNELEQFDCLYNNCTGDCVPVQQELEIYKCFVTGIPKYPYSVITGTPPCFSSFSLVEKENGERVQLKDLEIGEEILSVCSKTHQTVLSKVVDVVNHDFKSSLLKLTFVYPSTEEVGHLVITANHFMYYVSTSSSSDEEASVGSVMSEGIKLAKYAAVGDTVVVASKEDENRLKTARITQVEDIYGEVTTMYTTNGVVIVDDVVASIYSVLSSFSEDDNQVVAKFRKFYQFNLMRVYVKILSFGLRFFNWRMTWFKIFVHTIFENFLMHWG